MEFLLSRGLSVNHVSQGEPAICLATRLNSCEIVELLIKYGAKLAVQDASRQSPLAYSISHECATCIKHIFTSMQKTNRGQFFLSLLDPIPHAKTQESRSTDKAEKTENLKLGITQKTKDQTKVLAAIPINLVTTDCLKSSKGSLFQVQYITKDSVFESIQNEGDLNLPNQEKEIVAVS